MAQTFRGSRKHLLDLLDAPGYPSSLQAILAPAGIALTAQDAHHPRGHADASEWELPRFCQDSPFSVNADAAFNGWWVRYDGTLPTWDLISTCTMSGRPGILLIEAKAHESELDSRGKGLPDSASDRSKENHYLIGRCIDEVCEAMTAGADRRIAISARSHYQLSNRVAWAWRLAQHGVPVCLFYLGFLGDRYFPDYFTDSDHWQRAMGAYMGEVVPPSLPGRTVKLAGEGSFLILVKSLPVSEVSV